MKKFLIALLIIIGFIGIVGFFLNPFAAPSNDSTVQTITFEDDFTDDMVSVKLLRAGYIKSLLAYDIAINIKGKHNDVKAGGYYISKNMDTFKIIDKLKGEPDLKWVRLVEGLRKEQIGERLQKALGWTNEELDKWNTVYTAMKYDFVEGVYFPDTYLIPAKETGLEVAQRMINRFNEKLGTYLEGFAKKDILWTTGLKVASIIQREAGGKDDMPIISGILWNRLLENQRLQVDATIQYAKGKTNGQWWSVVTGADIRNIDSPYNTYQHVGLPPHPISNPGINAIDAALNPTETDCIFYLHDHHGQIHCSKTYEEHLEYIRQYL